MGLHDTSRGPGLRPLSLCMGAPPASVTGAQPRRATRGGLTWLPHRPSQRRAVSSPQHPPRCTSTVVTCLTKRPSVLLETVTAPRPEKHVLCADGHVLSSSRRGPELGSRSYATILRDPGPPGVVAGQCYGLDVPRRSAVTSWHPEQSVRPTGATDDRCSSRLSGGKLSGVTLGQAPAGSGGTFGGLPSRPL